MLEVEKMRKCKKIIANEINQGEKRIQNTLVNSIKDIWLIYRAVNRSIRSATAWQLLVFEFCYNLQQNAVYNIGMLLNFLTAKSCFAAHELYSTANTSHYVLIFSNIEL
jgi:hypothetical protein